MIHFDSNILNILSYLLIVIVGYVAVLFVLKDNIFQKYLSKLATNLKQV